MATNKTLAPTNVTISIPAMTDAPNASVLANCADKEADAINALNSQIAHQLCTVTPATNFTLTGNTKLARSGDVMSFAISVQTTSAITLTTAYMDLAYFDTSLNPKSGTDVFGIGYVYNDTNLFVIDIFNGKLTARTLTGTLNLASGTVLRGNISWIIGG